MRRRPWSAAFVPSCLVLAAAIAAAPAARAQGPVDGGFENGGTGWTLSDASIVNVGVGAFQGSRAVVIDPGASTGLRHGSLQARFPTTPGQEYRLVYAYQAGFAQGGPKVAVTIDGTEPLDIASMARFNDPGVERLLPERSAWLEHRVGFFANGTETLVQIGPLSRWGTHIGWGRIWIDHVRVEPLGRTRTFGRDLAARATLPSTALVGEDVDLTVSLMGLRRVQLSGSLFDARPMRHTGAFQLACDDGLAVLPAQVPFQGETTRSVRVRFGTPGVWRLRVRSGAYEVLSNPVYVTTQPLARRAYWGDLHIHTELGHSDWPGGTGAENYAQARGYADLDFAALTEHYYSTAKDWMDQLVPATEAHYQPGSFVTLLATETGGTQGHVNFYLRGSDPFEMFDGRNYFPDREAIVANMRSRGAKVLAIPHHFQLLDPVDWRHRDRASMRLAEIYSNHGSSEEAGNWWRLPEHAGNDYGDTQGSRGHDYRSALARGHRLGVVGCSDSHNVQPGLTGLTCVRSNALERTALWNTLYRRDCYATSGERILLDLQIGDAVMGEELFLSAGAPIEARVEVHGQDVIETIEFIRDGRVAASLAPQALDGIFTVSLGTFSGQATSFYVRVLQRNQHRAWSSPIWIEPAGKADLVLESGRMTYDRASGRLSVTANNFGEAGGDALLRIFSSDDEPSFGAETWLEGNTEPALIMRVEPVSASQARLKALLFTPAGMGRAFSFSGEIRIRNANGHRVVSDPRGMLVDDGNGTLSWNDTFGYRYLLLESKAGQVSDFELLVETQPGTVLEVQPRIDGAPLARVWMGSVLHSAPSLVSLPLGRIAATPPVAQATVSLLGRGARATVSFPLPSGATYVAVLDPLRRIAEASDDNNGVALLVPQRPWPYDHWTDYLGLSAADSGQSSPYAPPAVPGDPCCAPPGETATPHDPGCAGAD